MRLALTITALALSIAAPAQANYRDEVAATIRYSLGESGDFGSSYGVIDSPRVRCAVERARWTDDWGFSYDERARVCHARFRVLDQGGRSGCSQRYVVSDGLLDLEAFWCRPDDLRHLRLWFVGAAPQLHGSKSGVAQGVR